jgi:hypothetical protein
MMPVEIVMLKKGRLAKWRWKTRLGRLRSRIAILPPRVAAEYQPLADELEGQLERVPQQHGDVRRLANEFRALDERVRLEVAVFTGDGLCDAAPRES